MSSFELFTSCVLDFCMYLNVFNDLFWCLAWCWSSRSPLCLRPSPLCILWNVTKTLANNASPNGYVDHQTPKLKLAMGLNIFSLQSPLLLIDDNTTKQANNKCQNIKCNMQLWCKCSDKIYVMLKDTTWKLWDENYLTLLWYYVLKPPLHIPLPLLDHFPIGIILPLYSFSSPFFSKICLSQNITCMLDTTWRYHLKTWIFYGFGLW